MPEVPADARPSRLASAVRAWAAGTASSRPHRRRTPDIKSFAAAAAASTVAGAPEAAAWVRGARPAGSSASPGRSSRWRMPGTAALRRSLRSPGRAGPAADRRTRKRRDPQTAGIAPSRNYCGGGGGGGASRSVGCGGGGGALVSVGRLPPPPPAPPPPGDPPPPPALRRGSE
jgi:hypothetical protein